MPAIPDIIAAETHVEKRVTRSRETLSVRAVSVSRPEVTSSPARRVNVDHANSGNAASGTQNGVVPLKRLTAGRKELKIGHDGATYLLRITKSNKLILTKTDDATQGVSTS